MALHLYYKEGKLTRWRRVPINFRNRDEAENYYNKYFKGLKHKILFDEEEKEIARKKERRKQVLVKTGKQVKRSATVAGKNLAETAKATHERLKVAGPRDMDRIRSELGEPKHKTITAYDTRLREIKAERRRKERELTSEELTKLAERRAEKTDVRRERKAEATVKKKTWQPPTSPFGEFKLNLDQTPFTTHQKQAKKYEASGPGFKSPFAEVHFNPNVNPFGIETKKSKRRKK